MSRSGYIEDAEDNWAIIKWRGAVASAIRGRRGQAFLREMLASMDAMPKKRLIVEELVKEGEVCALGVVAVARKMDVSAVDPEDHEAVAAAFGITHAMTCEVMYENDEVRDRIVEEAHGPPNRWGNRPTYWRNETPEERFARMRAWVVSKLKGSTP